MMTARRFSAVGMMTAGLLLLAATSGMAATQIELDGNPLSFDVAPIQVGGRTMVPMRAIFEALGADVQWSDYTQSVTATRGDTDVQLTIGATEAQVDGRTVALDVPAMIHQGSTMVPLRFVSESLGADVHWSEARQLVSISTTGAPPDDQAPYPDPPPPPQTFAIPQYTVVPVALDAALSSETSNGGETFRVTVRSNQDGDAEFPRGTQLVGTVVGVQKADADQPGTLDLTFREARLPDGSAVPIEGSLTSLDDKAVTRSADGRLTAKTKKSDRLLMIGVGTGAGLIIGKLMHETLIGGLLGAAAGWLYGEFTKDKAPPADVVVKEGTVFGVRMDREVTYAAPAAFVAAREARLAAP